MHVEANDVVVTLTPTQAEHLAGALRLELAMRWEQAAFDTVPCREEIERARSLLDSYARQLENLCWGEPTGMVSVRWQPDRVSTLVDELSQGAEECLADDVSGQSGREMLATAKALTEALKQSFARPVPAR